MARALHPEVGIPVVTRDDGPRRSGFRQSIGDVQDVVGRGRLGEVECDALSNPCSSLIESFPRRGPILTPPSKSLSAERASRVLSVLAGVEVEAALPFLKLVQSSSTVMGTTRRAPELRDARTVVEEDVRVEDKDLLGFREDAIALRPPWYEGALLRGGTAAARAREGSRGNPGHFPPALQPRRPWVGPGYIFKIPSAAPSTRLGPGSPPARRTKHQRPRRQVAEPAASAS